MDPCLRSAVELRSALAVGEVSAVEVLEAVLGRADRLAGPINPFAVRLDERARSAASAADADLTLGGGGPLCGVPVTIKDSHYLAGVSAASGSRALEAFIPAESSAAVERLEAAGAVIFAKTTTPEFCYFGITDSPVNGRTSNPWDLGRTPGGSSGGAGAAVAAGLGPLALGGDGGGSIRIPAAFCGLVGFKPTFGLVPREPCAVGWKTLVAYGPMARSVADARLMLRALAGWHPRDRHSLDVDALDTPVADPHGLRVVASEDLGFAPLDDDVRAAFRSVVALLEDAGAQIVDDTTGLGSSVMTWSTIATAEARHSEASSFEHHHALLGEAAAEFMAHGGRVTREQYVSAQMAREPIHRAYVDLFDRSGASVLLTPTLGLEAFAHGSAHPRRVGGVPIEAPWLDWCGFLYDANLAGLPACAVPVGFGDDGLPVSVQVLGPRGSDGAVLAAAEAIERLVDFSARPTELETLEK
ncbi:amidase [Solirubrobacter ginsenosidimutans]|uniref:Amidase n=1 Tax=Solirubrobacter ginsenosidimutans TaxID=490573 RepID=A0A9X3S3T4_9ACTN|nr:amidase [Solirubrobacter ginsenosidimutans]MDA0164954.1 amidase [Solirubrobacter ginsenosidimutans]